MAHSQYTGLGQGQWPGSYVFLYYAMCCTHYTGTGTGRGNHCFLLCPSWSLSLGLSRPHAACMSHNCRTQFCTQIKFTQIFNVVKSLQILKLDWHPLHHVLFGWPSKWLMVVVLFKAWTFQWVWWLRFSSRWWPIYRIKLSRNVCYENLNES